MPVVKIWCLPANQMEESDFNKLHQDCVRAMVGVSELQLKNEKEMTFLFPPDCMVYGLGQEIIVEISGLFDKTERIEEVRTQLAEAVGKVVKEQFPNAKVEVFVQSFNPQQGFWTSENKGKSPSYAQALRDCDAVGRRAIARGFMGGGGR